MSSCYPIFEKDQVVTADQLNSIIRYFSRQQRITRSKIIGVGIICGLEVKYDSTKACITITKGCAISSIGDILYYPDDITFSKYKPFLDEKANS